jgi:ribosomal protein L11 methyltransferase
MDYIELSCTLHHPNPSVIEILIAELTDRNFESFMETDNELLAYIPAEMFNPHLMSALPKSIDNKRISYHWTLIEKKNWNEQWEKDYPPVTIRDECIVKAPFHTDLPAYPCEIIIEPKMSFGTGHHETTSLMLEMMLNHNFYNKTVLDIGCGTGVLAIMASKLGANSVFAADVDTWAYENSVENIERNHCDNIEIRLGGMEVICDIDFDVILANINRNILLTDMQKYSNVLKTNGNIFFSGIYKKDMHSLKDKAVKYNLRFLHFLEKNDWVVMEFQKSEKD